MIVTQVRNQFMYVQNRMSAPWSIRARELIINGFQDLPTILIIGSLLLGGVSGMLPLIVIGLGALIASSGYMIFQSLLEINDWNFLKTSFSSTCNRLPIGSISSEEIKVFSNMPNSWIFVITYFYAYLISNASTILVLDTPNPNNSEGVNNRQAQSISVIIALTIMYALFIFYRYKTGCETWKSLLVGLVLGIGAGIGVFMWATGVDLRFADVLQIVQNMEPSTGSNVKSIMCKKSD